MSALNLVIQIVIGGPIGAANAFKAEAVGYVAGEAVSAAVGDKIQDGADKLGNKLSKEYNISFKIAK